MVDLIAKSPCDGLLPLTLGPLTLSEVDTGPMTSIAPFKGQAAEASSVLKATHGMEAPGANRTTGKEGERVIWFGQNMYLLMGQTPDAALSEHAALTDQSDAWAVVRLQGAGAEDVLARLTPLDLRGALFKRGHTARTELRHMMASVTRVGAEAWMIMVFRGFAETLVHDLQTAMASVASRHP